MDAEREKLKVVICTSLYRIEGEMYILPGSRLTDQLNARTHDFLPITKAKVLSATQDKVLYEADYLALSREAILMVFPLGTQ